MIVNYSLTWFRSHGSVQLLLVLAVTSPRLTSKIQVLAHTSIALSLWVIHQTLTNPARSTWALPISHKLTRSSQSPDLSQPGKWIRTCTLVDWRQTLQGGRCKTQLGQHFTTRTCTPTRKGLTLVTFRLQSRHVNSSNRASKSRTSCIHLVMCQGQASMTRPSLLKRRKLSTLKARTASFPRRPPIVKTRK